MKKFSKKLFFLLGLTLSGTFIFFGSIADAQTSLSVKNVFVAQDVGCTTAEMDGILSGTYKEPISIIYQIGTTKEITAPVSLREVSGEIEFSSTLSDLKSGYSYNYHFKDSTEFGAPFGYGNFAFKPTVSGCEKLTTLLIRNLFDTTGDKSDIVFTGEITHGMYDPKTLTIYLDRLVAGAGPEEEPIMKIVSITKQGPAGGVDEFSVSIPGNLKPGSYNYYFADKNHAYIEGSSGYIGFEDLEGELAIVNLDVSPRVDTVVIAGAYTKNELSPKILFGTSPSKLDLSLDTKIVNSEIGFYATTQGLESSTTYFFEIVDSKDKNVVYKRGSFSTLSVASPSPDSDNSEDGDTYTNKYNSKAPSKFDMYYTPGVVTFLNVTSITQTSATIFGKARLAKNNFSVYLYEVDGPTSLAYDPDVKPDTREFSDNITNLNPNHLYMMYAGNPNDDTNNYSIIGYFETLPIHVTSGALSVSGNSAIITAKSTFGVKSLTIEYGTEEGKLDKEAGMNLGADGVWNAELADLSADTTYLYRIRIVSKDDEATETYTPLYEFITGASADEAGTTPYIVGPSGSTLRFFEGEDGGGIVPCSGVNQAGTRTTCRFEHVIKLINNVINFLMFALAPGLAAIIMLYGGVTLLTAGGSPEKIGEAKSLFVKAITGLIIGFAAWIIVKMVLIGMGYNISYFPAFF